MDIGSLVGSLLSDSSIGKISKASGTTAGKTKKVLESAMPSLIDGVRSQAGSDSLASGFLSAVAGHSSDGTSLSASDLTDGGKILSHLLGSSKSSLVKSSASAAGVSQVTANNVLSGASRLLMGLLGKETGGNTDGAAGKALLGALLENTDVSSIVSGFLKTGSASGSSSGSSDGKGVLGGILGLFGKK